MVVICESTYPSESKNNNLFEMYPYPLSAFQKHAIDAIFNGDHVLVTAHTGSGKTLPAEFAIHHFKETGKKVVYTSPIKALSNQKYYEFTKKFPNISFGLFTGDIKTNPDADVLIMTTEILMNYLFLGKQEKQTATLDFSLDVYNDLGCVIFDEVHYINDQDRGQVWEKTILMLPEHVQMVMLSATIDNPAGFAEWCESGRNGGTSSKKVYLASTNKRVVPLSHYGFMTINESIFKGMKDKELEKFIRENTNKPLMLQDEHGRFNDSSLSVISKLAKEFENKQVFMKRQNVLNRLAIYLKENEMLPAIGFVFSRKHVTLCAKEITVPLLEDDSKVPYTIARECEQVIRKLPNFQEYLQLPEYVELVGLLEKGIGIHHSGMIPVLREIVELMISKKYIKFLFATESFAIGLDCPIKTAVFTSLSKFDGTSMRYLLPHEYTQMAGRAGRRGLDTIGHVVHCNNLFDLPTINEYKNILSGKPQKLVSKFHISYSVVLNLLKNGTQCNFHEFSEKSILHNELIESASGQVRTLKQMNENIQHKTTYIHGLKTPFEVCKRYIELENTVKTLVNKKRKETEREMKNIEEEHKFLKDHVRSVRDYLELTSTYENEKKTMDYTNNFVKLKTDSICKILMNKGFIERLDDEENYGFLEAGKIASFIAEVHPLIITEFMLKTNYFEDFSIRQLVGLFSCFTDVKLQGDDRHSVPQSDDVFLKNKINELASFYEQYNDLEVQNDLVTGIKYDNVLIYDMIDFAMKWCDCEDEHSCKYFIQNDVAEKSISIGDFNKAMMKVVTISKELMNVCEQFQKLDLLYKLSKIESLLLKYVATSQSLYV
jgi:superfamily II RNA helicase